MRLFCHVLPKTAVEHDIASHDVTHAAHWHLNQGQHSPLNLSATQLHSCLHHPASQHILARNRQAATTAANFQMAAFTAVTVGA